MDINKSRSKINGSNLNKLDASSQDMTLGSDDDEVPDSPKSPFSAKFWASRKAASDNSTSNVIQDINIYDSKQTSYKTLDIICHAPKFNGPYYTDSSLKPLTISEQIARIMKFHCIQAENFHKYQRKSLVFAKWGKPINPSTNVEDTNDNLNDSIDSLAEEDTYISRSGRQMKRKVYTEDEDFNLSSLRKKKGKLETTPKPKSKKLSNEEIMNRSTLFADSPNAKSEATGKEQDDKTKVVSLDIPILNVAKRSKPTDTRKRCEVLFDNCAEQTAKAKKHEAVMSIFEDSLREISDDEKDFDLKITSSQIPRITELANAEGRSTSTIIKKRVIPPVVGRRGYRRKQAYQIIEESPPQMDCDINDSEENHKKNGRGIKKTTACPICSKVFPQKEIEEHASTCGITAELEIENNLPNKDQAVSIVDSLICAKCDRMFLVNTEYEVHVTECCRNKHN